VVAIKEGGVEKKFNPQKKKKMESRLTKGKKSNYAN
jgi:hypothetical protein